MTINFGGKSILYVNGFEGLVSIIINKSRFSNNSGTALHLVVAELFFKGNILFINNSGSNGAAVYMEKIHDILFDDNANVQFVNNSAELKGGAMYINLVDNR